MGLRVLAILVFLNLFIAGAVWANNLTISNVSLETVSIANDTLEFDVYWENSWCEDGAICDGDAGNAVNNFDAAWVFAKYAVYDTATKTWGDWTHCKLSATDGHHIPPTGALSKVGLTDGVGMGVFLYRSGAGTGTNTWTNARIRWDRVANGVAADALLKFKVFGVEMVYIPTGSFYAGDTASTASLKQGSGDTDPWYITGETQIDVTAAASNGYYYVSNANAGELDTGSVFSIPAAFPKGYNAFYIMKYEVSQGQYRDFLNTLNRTQQQSRVANYSTAKQYSMPNLAFINYRNGVRNAASIAGSGPYTFGCDLDGVVTTNVNNNTLKGNETFDEPDDGEWVAMNYMSWPDGAAYTDWAGLRPFTELEFEKAARGPGTPVSQDYAWGTSANITQVTALSNPGESGEVSDPLGANLAYNNPNTLWGPVRSGAFARGATGRIAAGSSYYGVMELSGNLWERPVTVGNSSGYNFDGSKHGDGILSGTGYANESTWPGLSAGVVTLATGSGFRGGSWIGGSTFARVSDRTDAAGDNADRSDNLGFRAARASP
jgi:formylglycine-generating enzyme required for sulfatase activity